MSSNTAVLTTNSAAVSSRLIHGVVIERKSHARGTVLILPPGEIAVFCVRAVKYRTFVFRTLVAAEPLSTAVPGVNPGVRLLVQTQTLGRLQRIDELLRYLAKIRQQPSSLSDAFYLRLHGLLSGRLPRSGKVLRSLLEQEKRASQMA